MQNIILELRKLIFCILFILLLELLIVLFIKQCNVASIQKIRNVIFPFNYKLNRVSTINITIVNGKIIMLRVIGEFFEWLDFVECAQFADRDGHTCRNDGGDNMQMQLLRHERTQLPGANGRAAPVSSGYLTSITLTRDDSRIPARHNKVRSNKNDRSGRYIHRIEA